MMNINMKMGFILALSFIVMILNLPFSWSHVFLYLVLSLSYFTAQKRKFFRFSFFLYEELQNQIVRLSSTSFYLKSTLLSVDCTPT
jgi:hypothetical protein